MVRKILVLTSTLVALFLGGTVGFKYIEEDWTYFDSFYMTVISLTTVGYGEVRPLSHAGRVFTVFLLLGGVGTLAYGISTTTAFLVGGQFAQVMRKRAMESRIRQLSAHIVLCGLGETGRHVAEEFVRTHRTFVAVEKDPERIATRLKEFSGLLYVEGDATSEGCLESANIHNVFGLVTCLPDDKDNIFVVLTAREFSPNIRIISRVIHPDAEAKLQKVGADATVSSNYIGGMRMASELLRPTVVSFLDTMLRDSSETYRVEEATITAGSPLMGKSLREASIPRKTGLLVLAVQKNGDRRYTYNPEADSRLEAGDIIVVMGKMDQIDQVREMAEHG